MILVDPVFYSMALSVPRSLVPQITKTMMLRASNALRLVRLIPLVTPPPALRLLLVPDVLSGVAGIIKKIRDTVGDSPVYLSIDVSHIRTFLDRLVANVPYVADRLD